jgi:ATPase family AAA domain-containing protein 2
MIRDVTSSKKFYGMDLDQVNDRIWDGYYLAPSQFIFDIQCMVHDSKTWPDRDRTNRAEEMLVNTQTYISEVFDETLVLECQRMAEREFERQKFVQAEQEAKAKKRIEKEREKERLRLAALQATQENQSPLKMIEQAPDDVIMLDVNGTTYSGPVTNGIEEHDHQNGHHWLEDQMIPESSPFGSQDVFPQTQDSLMFGPHQPHHIPLQTNTHALMEPSNMYSAPQPDYSPRTSFYPPMQQAPPQPNLRPPYPQYGPNYVHPPYLDQRTPAVSPPTEPYHDQRQFYPGPTTPGPVHLPPAASAAPLRNGSPNRSPVRAPEPSHPPLKRDPARVDRLLQDITRSTEGYTLERLEQLYAACMDVIWRTRHEWDRVVVIAETEKCVVRVLKEIEMMKEERERDRLGKEL